MGVGGECRHRDDGVNNKQLFKLIPHHIIIMLNIIITFKVYTTSKPCTLCGYGLAEVKHSTYWEGGQGCRNKVKMNRQVSFEIFVTLKSVIYCFITEMISTSTVKAAKRLPPSTLKGLECKEKRIKTVKTDFMLLVYDDIIVQICSSYSKCLSYCTYD